MESELFHFARPYILYGFVLIPVFLLLFILSVRRRKKLLAMYGESKLVMDLAPDVSSTRPIWKLVLLMLAFTFFILSLAGPMFGVKLQEAKRKGAEIIIALDVSNSMLAEDIAPSRLDRSKQAISRLVDRLQSDRIGLIVFAGEAYTQLPVTSDYVSAKMFLSTINPNLVPVQGTAIGEAINLATRSFSETTDADKTVIVISDGENHEDNPVEAAESATEKGITVNVVGVGSSNGAPIPLEQNGQKTYLKDNEGNVVITKMDDKMLSGIAAAGKGQFVIASGADMGLDVIMGQVSKLKKSEYKAKLYTEFEDQYQWPLALAFLFLFLEFIILEKKNPWLKRIQLFSPKKKI
ncbi:MAG TPA: VWA domain-containing protein [Bacteroidales bacterium]|nr:VWA domain-containing protein [Bacteroidales bacterium]